MAQKKTKSAERQAEVMKKATTPPQERVDAGSVEGNFKQQANDEVLGVGDDASDKLHDVDAAEDQLRGQARAGAPLGGVRDGFLPSTQINPYATEEEQGMEMRPAIVGPPAYGSPRPETSAGRLLPLEQHPLRAAAFPEGHPAAISDDYGEGYTGTLSGVDTVTSRPSAPMELTDLQRDAAGQREQREASQAAEENSTEAAAQLARESNVDLAEVEGTGKDGNITVDDVREFVRNREDA